MKGHEAWVDDLIAKAKLTPYEHLPGYMNRYWLTKPPGEGDCAARIHEILRSDNDRHLHDHPWDYTTIILRNGYFEDHYKDGELVRSGFYGPGTVLQRKAGDAHRLVLPYGPVWTLFIMGPWQQVWGFLTPGGKIPWSEYLG